MPGLVPVVVGARVLEVEEPGLLEVDLERRHLPAPADGVADVHVDLRGVERALALGDDVRDRRPSRAPTAAPRWPPPSAPGRRRTSRAGSPSSASKSSKPKAREDRHHERQEAGQLVGQLLVGAEDVRVVLGEAPRPQQAVEDARALEAVHGPELEEAQRQLAVGALLALVDQDVHRAVHGLRVVRRPLHLHGGVHAVGVPVEVPAAVEQARPRARCGV